MRRLGHEPTKVSHGGSQLFYRAPWRSGEREGSLHATQLPDGKWVWYDFGDASRGGTVVDLVMRLNGGSVGEALATLKGLYGGVGGRGRPAGTDSPVDVGGGADARRLSGDGPTSNLELVEVLPLRSGGVLGYLAGRGIGAELAREYLRLVRYRNSARPGGPIRYGFGQVNRSGGYEVRSASDTPGGKFRTCIGGRDVSLHPGASGAGETVSVFEGMLDHLSLLAYREGLQTGSDALVLHSLSSHGRAVDLLKERGYLRIDLYLDNDAAGRKATARLQAAIGAHAVDRSGSYAPYADLNDALRAGHPLGVT